MKKLNVLLTISVLFVFLMSGITMMSAAGVLNESSTTRSTRGTVVSYTINSPHNYANNYDNTWTITKSGASQIRAYFYRYQVETNYDFIYIYDGAGTQLAKYTSSTSKYYVWTPWATGDTIKIRLVTDYSVTKWGFRITQYEYETGSTPPPPPSSNVLTSGQTAYSSLSATGATEMWTIEVASGATNMHSVLNCGSQDFDLYGRKGSAPTTSTYDWRGYTSGGEDVNFANPGAGTWYIMARSYSGSGSYDLTVTITTGGGGGGSGWGTGGKYAILVGISDYHYINDLSYCDEDVTDMYNYLIGKGYQIHVWGDGHTANFPIYNGLATETNVRADVQALSQVATSGAEVIYWSSGHGGATGTYDGAYQYSGSNYAGNNPGTGFSYELMYNFQSSPSSNNNPNDESYSAQEMSADFAGFTSGVNIMIGIDRCQSGGMGYVLQSNAHYTAGRMLVITTCGVNGYGYDQSAQQNGKFTYWIHQGLTTGGQTSFEGAFNWMNQSGRYLPVSHNADLPQIFDGFTGSFVP